MVTAVIKIKGEHKDFILTRSLVDTCATSNFMTKGLADRLGLTIQRHDTSIGALNTLSTTSPGIVMATIKSRHNKYEKRLTFVIVPNIADNVPSEPLDRGAIKIPKNCRMADPKFYCPTPVDVLLGAGVALSLLCVGQVALPKTRPDTELYIHKTLLGWVIGGSAPVARSTHHRTCLFTNELLPDLSRFWDIDDGPVQQRFTKEETACEEHFKKHVTRNEEGRYTVALPFNENIDHLGDSKIIAGKRLKGLEHRLSKDSELREQYDAVLSEYVSLGHMSPISKKEEDTEGYYLPHHAVIKETSLTTKVRVVFDGSCKTSTGCH